ncbi:crossover junction endodeoxyribonuclease RuvC [Phenylobacterium sp.]|uniref:crossover junction endodeoxyribonuclease RuvC n=1 Tax=Phenylobacterium sp. TaxID=1871053 RepID=UPI0025DFD55B|nr:crossover junction endodeoxyribonuclease RuvC [Phenylobacterium sp.]
MGGHLGEKATALMRCLGIDPGSLRCGYAIIDVAPGFRLTFVEAGVITAPKGRDQHARLVEIGCDLEAVIADFRPDTAAVEAGFVQHLNGALTLGASRGVVCYVCGRAGLTVTEYAPSTAKKAATGNGAASKEDVARIVAVRLGLRKIPDGDTGDAISIAICRAADRDAGWVERPRVAKAPNPFFIAVPGSDSAV